MVSTLTTVLAPEMARDCPYCEWAGPGHAPFCPRAGRVTASTITALMQSRPGLWATSTETAAWLLSKAGVLDRIAADPTTTAADAADARECAATARARAATLLGGAA